ncbi:MAG: diguanylate cyclase domain-containing protein [Terracidiphilus sp.]
MGPFLERDLDDKLRQQMLAYGQRHDVQTGFLNYKSFQESLAVLLRDRAAGREVALIWIEVLNLRREFSLLGSRGAEALIDRVAVTLRSAVDSGAFLGRYSARCFLVAIEAKKFDGVGRRRIQAIAEALSPVCVLGSRSMVEVAAGAAYWPSDTVLPDDLVRFASLAASRASYLKSPCVLAFRSGMNQHLMRDHMLEMEMHRGLARISHRRIADCGDDG